MSSPAAQRAATQALPGAKREDKEREFLSAKVVTHQALKVLAELDLELHPAAVRKVVHRFIDTGRSDLDFRTWFLAYADPTGESAVRRTMKTRGY